MSQIVKFLELHDVWAASSRNSVADNRKDEQKEVSDDLEEGGNMKEEL